MLQDFTAHPVFNDNDITEDVGFAEILIHELPLLPFVVVVDADFAADEQAIVEALEVGFA